MEAISPLPPCQRASFTGMEVGCTCGGYPRNMDPSMHPCIRRGRWACVARCKKGLEARRMSRRGPGASGPDTRQPGFGSKGSGYLFLFTRFPVYWNAAVPSLPNRAVVGEQHGPWLARVLPLWPNKRENVITPFNPSTEYLLPWFSTYLVSPHLLPVLARVTPLLFR